MKRITIPDKETFISAIKDEMSKTPEGRYFLRLHVILLYLKGTSSSEIARLYDHSPRTIQYWVRKLLSDGLKGLWDKERAGRPSQLFRSVRKKLQTEIRHSPRELGYEQDLWNGRLLSNHLKERYAIVLGIRQCQRLLHQMGFRSGKK
ncbi:MAG: helix-turn-helix domain-containing protein [Candidatus Scalinduaceae bacterium]